MEQQELVRIARRRASAKFGFLIHLTVFIAVNAMLFFINQSTSPGVAWSMFPLAGWGLGLSIHGLAVFLSGSGLRERMIEGELRKLRSSTTPGAR